MSRTFARLLAAFLAVALVAAACSDDEKTPAAGGSDSASASGGGGGTEAIDFEAIGLWDDGPCDASKPKLVIGLMTVFESGKISLKDQATALEASAEAFNERGGANGSCIEVHTCDDGANVDQAVACVRELDGAGVVATVNDQGTAGQAEVRAAMDALAIPRVASNVSPQDWDDPLMYPMDASGTGVTLLQPKALIEDGVKEIGVIRVSLAEASALLDLLKGIYAADGATFPFDAPVPEGTTDFSQFILGAQGAGVGGVSLSLGEQEAVQVIRAAQQLGTDLKIGGSIGTFAHSSVAELGDFANQMVFLWAFPPATFDLPVYKALRADMTASGDESLQPANLKGSPMRSWIGLYALLKMIRDAKLTDFSRASITAMLNEAKDVPMLDMFGGENWTPNTDHQGLLKRAGMNHWAVYTWDPNASADGLEGNFVEKAEISFDAVLCGSPLGAPAPC